MKQKNNNESILIEPNIPTVVMSDNTIIIPYSLKNKKTNDNLPISILNPLINSLSPSNKSNGARFVSIKDKSTHRGTHRINNSFL
jgi:hypothetical protein